MSVPNEVSIVVPVYNEEESVEPLFAEIRRAMDPLNAGYEVIFVDDASSDKTPGLLAGLRDQFPGRVRIITLPGRSGQTYAMREGLKASTGEVAVTMDADLQNDPADIPRLLARMREGDGFDAVCGWRKARQDRPLKTVLSKTGNILQRLFTGLSVHDVSCTLRAYKKKCVPQIPLNWEGQHRFIPLCLALQGFRVGEIESNHRNRKFGYSKYSHKRIFKVVVDFFRILIARGRR